MKKSVKTLEKFIPAMAKLHAQAFSPGWPEADFCAHIQNPTDHVFCLGRPDDLVGFIIGRTISGQSEILTMLVAPHFHRQGYAKTLLALYEDAAMAMKSQISFLEVATNNIAAICLYESEGYTKIGRRPGYYKQETKGKLGRIDALIYQKKLGAI